MDSFNFYMVQADIESAILCLHSENDRVSVYDKMLGCFHIQQACEKLIKLQLYLSHPDIPNSETRIHDILKLQSVAIKYKVPLVLSSYLIKYSDTLTDWEDKHDKIQYFSPRINMVRRCLKEIVSDFNRVSIIHTGEWVDFSKIDFGNIIERGLNCAEEGTDN